MIDHTRQHIHPQAVYPQTGAPLYPQVGTPLYQQYVQPPVAAPATSPLGLNIQDSQFWKGALLGVAVTMLVTNESLQKGVVKTVSKLTLAAQCGLEEMKEKFEDAKAEAQAETVIEKEK